MANTGNTQQQINYGASANDGQGDPLRTAFIKTDDNFDNVWLAGPVGSNITIGNNTIQSNNTNGNIILKPNGTGIVQANASIIPNADGVRDLGSSAQAWRRAYIDELLPTDLTVSGDAVIQGNLTVEGDTIQIGNITTDTLTIQLANTAANAASANGAGITVGASDNIATILYNSTANRWNVSVGMSAVGNISAPYFLGNGSLLTGITSYGNANVAANLAAFANNPIFTTGNVSTGTLSVTGNIRANTAGNIWSLQDNAMVAPSGAYWLSNKFTLDEYIQSAVDGYLNLQTYDNTSNVATELHMEHGIVQLNIYNGNNVTWAFDSTGNLTLPGNTFAVNYANGSAVSVGSTYGNANVAANLAAFSNNPISTTGNVSTGNLSANSAGNIWRWSNDAMVFPSGAYWRSNRFSLDEYISSATDGYLNLQTYDNTSNVATELHMEHGVIQFNIYNGTRKIWEFNENGSTTFPGDVFPSANLGGSLGNSSLYWSNLWVANNTIYIGGVPLGMTAGNVLTVNGNAVLSNNSNTAVTTTGNITAGNVLTGGVVSATGNISANYFLGNGSQLTGLPATYGNANVVANLAALSSNPISTTGNVTAGNILTGGLISATGNITAGNLTVGSGTINGGNVNGANFNGNVAFGTGTVGGSGNITGGNISAIGNISGGNLSLSGNITSDIGFTGATITINNAPGGVEGAEIRWALPSAANTVLNTSLIQDVFQNGMRFFESGGNSRGLYMDLGNVPNGSGTAVGYRDIPQVSFTGNATLAATDAGRHYYSTLATANTLTIANNTSVSWTVGTAITVVNRGSGTITIAQGTGVSLYLAGNSSAGNRTIATYGMATLLNVAANVWMINGSQVT